MFFDFLLHESSSNIKTDTWNLEEVDSKVFSNLQEIRSGSESPSSHYHSDQSLHEAFESPAAYISRLKYENSILIFTHSTQSTIQAKNRTLESWLTEKDFEFAVCYLDKIGDEGVFLEAELKRQTCQRLPPWVFLQGVHRTYKSLIRGLRDGQIQAWLSPSQEDFEYDLIIIGDTPAAVAATETAVTFERKVLFVDIHDCGEMQLTSDGFDKLQKWIENSPPNQRHWQCVEKWFEEYCQRQKKRLRLKMEAMGVRYVQGETAFVNAHTISVGDRKFTGLNFLLAGEYESVSMATVSHISNKPGAVVFTNSILSFQLASVFLQCRVPVVLLVDNALEDRFDRDAYTYFTSELKTNGVKFLNARYISYNHVKDEHCVKTSGGCKRLIKAHCFIDALESKFDSAALNVESIGVQMKNSFIVCNPQDQTSVSNIYAIGSIVDGRPLNPMMATTAARLLIKRLCGTQEKTMDYTCSTSILHSSCLEYGCVGLGEEAAVKAHGADNVVVYKSISTCFDHVFDDSVLGTSIKMVCLKPFDWVVGMHFVGTNVEAKLFGYALAMRNYLVKAELDASMALELSGIRGITRMGLGDHRSVIEVGQVSESNVEHKGDISEETIEGSYYSVESSTEIPQ